MKNLYYQLLNKILIEGSNAISKKGSHKYLINETLSLNENSLFKIFDEHQIARTKLENELELYLKGENLITEYNNKNIIWWDYCKPNFINSYPDYFKYLPSLINEINTNKKYSRNYILIIGDNNYTNQKPCINIIQFQLLKETLYITAYLRSSDANLGLPSDLWQTFLISEKINITLANITFFIGNVHIYNNNIENTYKLLEGKKVKFILNT